MYQTTYRAQLLCHLFECISRIIPTKFKSFGPYLAVRLHKDDSRTEVKLSLASFAIVEFDMSDRVIQEYKWTNISKICIDNTASALYFVASGRIKIFYSRQTDLFLSACQQQIRQLGISSSDIELLSNQSVVEAITSRKQTYQTIPTAVSVFDVSKYSSRQLRQMPRQMHISEDFVFEKDSSGEIRKLSNYDCI